MTPPADRTLHAIGDVQGATVSRMDIMMADLARDVLHDVPRVTLGDCTANGTSGDDSYFLTNFANRIPGGVYRVLGNHDVGNSIPQNRTAAAAAAALGMPAKDYTVDLDFAVLIILSMDELHPFSSVGCVYHDSTLTWLDGQLQTHSNKPCILAAHAPLMNTVRRGPGAEGNADSANYGWFAMDEASLTGTWSDAAIRAVIADNANVVAWLSGHTHSVLDSKDIAKAETIGGRQILALNTSSILNPGVLAKWTTGIASPFVTVYDDRLEVRWRNHGAHQWVGAGRDLNPLFTVNL